jgi:hypothetical protein
VTIYVMGPQGRLVDKATGAPMVTEYGPIPLPAVRGDLPGYASPVDGRWIDGRRARRDDLERNDCVDAGDRPVKRLKNERFARKHGLERLLET